MASVPAPGYRLILEDRHFDDYASMKAHFRNAHIKEWLLSVVQASSVTTTLTGYDAALATQLTAEAVVFLRTEADDANQDLQSVWVTYQDDTGAIHGPIEHLLNDTADTTVEACLGNEDVNDTIAAGQGGKVITLTALAGTLNQYAGLYMVTQSGDGVGNSNLIVSNTAATPTILTVTDNTHAAANGDVIQIQTYPCDDFYRVREMYCEVEPLDDKQIILCDHDASNIYAAISEGGRYACDGNFFTQPVATCLSYLGRVKATAPTIVEGDAANGGAVLSCTFTPRAANTDGDSADITMTFQFYGTFEWEPCIQLEPATDVLFSITDIATATNVHVEASILEVYDTEYPK